ncbi:uncharacterized protein LOC132066235 [Lycium ferocissimum]|uniref:uncharacterized protein LOC132066235 n=1 Tax=Lycium ferocissimum TaxID=112874 RepID=UPI002814FC75|nr:uncharacterized protein LOC132066235 [Lycium ferocissimum]
MSKNGPQINHLCYADDLILFSSGERKSVKLLMKVLRDYEEASGQEINKDKTNFYTYGIQSRRNIRRLHRWTGYKHAKLPFTYLGCPIYTGRKTCNLFSDLATKFLNKAGGWQVPLVTIMKQIEMYFSNSFWGKKDDKNKYHWSSWEKMSYPYEEGGVGFKRLSDIFKAFATKRWWRFRTNDNLWARFLKAKYCPRSNPISKKKNSKDSNAWKTMLNTRAEAEKYIIWRIAEGKVLFWWDTWTAFGLLNQLVNQNLKLGNNKVNEYKVDGAWDQTKLSEVLPQQVTHAITQQSINTNSKDKAIWTLNNDGNFSIASAFKQLRQKRDIMTQSKEIWSKGLPFKISFFMWRLIKKNLPFDDTLTRFGIQPDTRCTCCRVDKQETLNHVFARSELAHRIWKIAEDPLGIKCRHQNVLTTLNHWWTKKPANAMHKALLQISPSIKNTTDARIRQKLLFQVKVTLGKVFSRMEQEWSWEVVCDMALNRAPMQIHQNTSPGPIRTEMPEHSSYILNTDGSCSSSLAIAGAGGVVRKRNGEMVMAFAKPIQFLTNNSSEIQAALYGLKWCRMANITNLTLQLDSLFVVQMIIEKCKVPWNYQRLLEEIKTIVHQRNIKVVRCFREENMVADAMSKHANSLDQESFIYQERELPTKQSAWEHSKWIKWDCFF